ncbi:hypothetical protein QY049_03610 [Bradyrhizobium sp. WYCCWR 13022]|uniref:hypothetical protein n=1 Tax=unclassified Bradyrhizobium TaxID=2631580 RepID=UPI00263B3543|nr:hypothetical protein [Bradyrhizobium sp. WYCCWR 13022]MDN4982310.1 hypothetical protein [Bradyrhizobium sp. WYCCWR 13022]
MKRRRNRILSQFAARPIEMLESPAFRALSLAARRVLDRVEIESAHHGGQDNGKLPVTFDQFCEYGLHRHSIAPGIRECVALGFLEITQKGRAGNAEHRAPNLFRLTYRYADGVPGDGSHEWKSIKCLADAERLAAAARAAKSFKKTKNQCREMPSFSAKNRHRNLDSPVPKTGTKEAAKTGTTSISRDPTEQTPREARLPQGAVASGAAGHDEPIRLDHLHARLAQKLSWDVVSSMSDSELEAAAELERVGSLDGVAAIQIRLRNKVAGGRSAG